MIPKYHLGINAFLVMSMFAHFPSLSEFLSQQIAQLENQICTSHSISPKYPSSLGSYITHVTFKVEFGEQLEILELIMIMMVLLE